MKRPTVPTVGAQWSTKGGAVQAVCPGQGIRGCTVGREFINSNKTTASRSDFYYHHASATLNNVSDKLFLCCPVPRATHTQLPPSIPPSWPGRVDMPRVGGVMGCDHLGELLGSFF